MKNKYFYLLLIFFVSTISTHASLGKHNVQLNLTGGYHLVSLDADAAIALDQSPLTPKGGLVGFEFNYLLHGVRESGLINGFDIRLNFKADFSVYTLSSSGSGTHYLDTGSLSGGFAMVYTLGRQLSSGRIMFDFIGFGIQGGIHDLTQRVDQPNAPNGGSLRDLGEFSFVGLQYILPGFQFMMNNGFSIGWRNNFQFNGRNVLNGNLLQPRLVFDTYITLGFTYGK